MNPDQEFTSNVFSFILSKVPRDQNAKLKISNLDQSEAILLSIFHIKPDSKSQRE